MRSESAVRLTFEMSRVLIVEDDEVIGQSMARHLAAAGFDPVWVDNGRQGLAKLRFEQPDVCVVDLMLPQVDGWKLIEQVRSEGIGTPIVVVSARGETPRSPPASRASAPRGSTARAPLA